MFPHGLLPAYETESVMSIKSNWICSKYDMHFRTFLFENKCLVGGGFPSKVILQMHFDFFGPTDRSNVFFLKDFLQSLHLIYYFYTAYCVFEHFEAVKIIGV